MGHKTLPKAVMALFGSDEVSLVFQKMLAFDLFRWIFINSYLHRVESKVQKERKVYFVPEHYEKRASEMKKSGDYQFRSLPRVKFYPWVMPLLPFIHAYDKIIFWSASVLYPFLYLCLFGMGRLIGKSKSAPAHYRYGIPLDQVFQVKLKGKRTFDVLLDHKGINKNNSVFIMNIPSKKLK